MSDPPVQAVILAAGEGRRLTPLTNRRPKPMIPVGNKPLLEYIVEAVAAAGVEQITLVVGYRQERIRNHFADGDEWGVTITYVEQPTQLGTGHAVLQAEPVVDGPFVVLNGDRIVEPAVIERVAATVRGGTSPVVTVTTVETPRAYGVVTGDGETVRHIEEKPDGPVETNQINAGIYGFTPAVFETIRTTHTTGELTLTTALNEHAREQGGIEALTYIGQWLDVSNLWDLLRVNAGLIETTAGHGDNDPTRDRNTVADDVVLADSVRVGPNVTIGGNTAIGRNVTIEPNAVVENAIIFPDTVIGAGTVIRDAVVASNVRIGPNVTIDGPPDTMVVEDAVHHDIELGGVVGDNTTIGPSATLTTGAVVGDDVETDAGVTIDSRIAAGTTVRRG
ncbi:sugar phosphate nucleotidyltransferase [Halorubrum sp. GN12_10-3_MGM]|uniref:sugar phosphate nucleotidyltransferase n=1 Tax=Halorubrum sp. GN12_10-3_MGM TaxID=2518113 RepID=UPI0010F89308|nr:sugar phosphate nucleotidyltransferase [Halorubrum sp. GN12_10-3_MGM]TKX61869.1 glucose-1-phosphate thymidylyltransferase [Halorubrum sp. GN12_10-3_MGM]